MLAPGLRTKAIHQPRRPLGFTLIELMIVVAVIGIVAAIVAMNYAHAKSKAQVSTSEANMRQIAAALELYDQDYGDYPTCATIDSTCFPTDKYLPTVPLTLGQEYILRTGTPNGFKIKDPNNYDTSLLSTLTNFTTGLPCGTTCNGIVYTEYGGLSGRP